MSTTEESKTEGKKAGEDAPPVNIGWDSHKPVVGSSHSSLLWPKAALLRETKGLVGVISEYLPFLFLVLVLTAFRLVGSRTNLCLGFHPLGKSSRLARP